MMKSLKIIKKNDLRDWAEELFQKNSYKMVDVSSKKETFRRALATGKIYVGEKVTKSLALLREKSKIPELYFGTRPQIVQFYG